VRLYTITGADWSKRYPLIVESAAYVQGSGHSGPSDGFDHTLFLAMSHIAVLM
jgi:hypothetical protein